MDNELLKEVTEIASQKAIEIYESEKETAFVKEQNRRLRNTKLLLKNYRSLKDYINKIDSKVKCSVPKIEVDENKNIIDLIKFGEDIVNSIRESSKTTIAMVQYIDKALSTLEHIYKQEENERYYSILKNRYIDGMSIGTIADKYYLNKRSVYKILDSVAERLSVLLFGVYGVKIE